LIECHKRVNGVNLNVRQKSLLLQCLNQLCESSRDLTSDIGI
jgi:hypothetical protein